MKKILYLTIILGLLGVPCPVMAQNDEGIPDGPIRNPFMPQLPEKKEEIEEPPSTSPGQTSGGTQTIKPKPRQVKRPQQQSQQQDSKPVPPPLPKPDFRITGLIWNSDRPQAIINGQVLDIGDEIQGFRIEAIRPTGIDVSIRGVKLTVEP